MRNRGFIVFMVMLVVLIVAVQYARIDMRDRVMDEINIIGTDAHSAAMKAPWEDNDYWSHPQSIIHAKVSGAEVHEVKHSTDLRWDEVYVLMGGQIYLVITKRGVCKEGDVVDLHIKLKYEPISKQRKRTVWMVEEMEVL